MKNIAIVLGAFLTLFLVSCEGDPGPPGFDGLDGIDGVDGIDGAAFEAAAFEIEDVDMDFNADLNRYDAFFQYPSDITLLPDDVVLLYRFESVDTDLDLDVWRQLPQPFFSDEGLLYYNFDFTQKNYGVFVEPEFDANLVPADLTENQIFRIVIIPANLGASAKMDTSNFSSVMSSLGISEKDIQKIRMN